MMKKPCVLVDLSFDDLDPDRILADKPDFMDNEIIREVCGELMVGQQGKMMCPVCTPDLLTEGD